MGEPRTTVPDAASGAGPRTGPGFELRLERGGAHVRLSAPATAAELTAELIDLEVPDVTMPVDVGAGPSQFQNRLCELCQLTVRLEPGLVTSAAARLDLASLGLERLEVAPREGFLEVVGRLAGGPALALRLGLVPGFERGVLVVPFAPRLFGPSRVPAAALPHLAARALAGLGLPEDPLQLLLRRLLVSRGWKVPREGSVRLALAAVTPAGVRLSWDRDAPAPAGPAPDPDLLAAVEGARAFADAEALVAAGDWSGARDAFLAAPSAAAHPFAADRLLSLLCLDERFHDEALDLAAEWLARRPGFGPALAAEAAVRASRGEGDRAALALAGLAEDAVARGERLVAAAAAEAALAQPGAGPIALQRAVDAALAVKRDHLPALRALRALAQGAGDQGARLRAVRRLLAYAPTDVEKARAHAELGELLLDKDPPAARLHLDRALRLAPDDAESLATLAHACTAAGEHLRAVRALDRLRALKLAAGDREAAARLARQAGELWETRLGHLENALLRYREAAELGPGAAEAHGLAAACAERLGRWAEAADHHAAALSHLDRRAPGAAGRAAAHHLALADVAELRLEDPAGAATHLEAALADLPADPARLSRLAALYRRLGRPAELLAALDRLAPLAAGPAERAALLAEAGELCRGPLGRADAAQARFAAALAQDGACRTALEGLAAVAALRGDAAAERDALARLVTMAAGPDAEAALLDRLAAAAERAGDLHGAVRAVAAARRAAPTRGRLAAEVALARRAEDPRALAGLLDELARAALADGDLAAAAAAWRERAERLEGEDPALALAALGEARRLLPGDQGLLRRQAALAARAGDHPLALDALRALLAGGAGDAPALELQAARAALAAGRPAEARPHAERALDADAPGAADLLAEILSGSGDEAGRAALLVRLGRHAEAAALRERTGDAAGALAAWEAAAEEPATAAEALRALIRLRARAGDAAGTAAALLAAARLAGGREGAELALRAFHLAPGGQALDAAVAADPAFAPARAERAARRAEADPAGALGDAEAALAADDLDPTRRPGLLRLSARLADATGDVELQRRRLAAWCQLGAPDDAELAALGALHRAAGDQHGLSGVLARRLETAPAAEAVALRLELAPLLVEQGRDLEAVARWREALSIDRGALPALRALLDPARAGVLLDGEAPALLALLARHPEASDAERAEAHEALARLREAAGDAAGALAALGEAARLRGEDDEGLERRAALARRSGDLGSAAALLLSRARRGLGRDEAGAPERLVEAGLLALEAGRDADGEAALREALAHHPEPEASRSALEALRARAVATGDEAAEAAALAPLVALLPTGQRPAGLLRLSALRAASGDAVGALAAAEEARTLAPRDLATVHHARAAAEAAGQPERVAALLAEEAGLDEARAGPLHLDRARLLARLGDAAQADDAFTEALRLLGPDLALSAEQARHRRAALPDRPAAAPLEAFARRAGEPAVAARAFLAASALALQEGDRGAALRCARRAAARRREAPAEAGPLLARLLYEQGASAEALVLHRTLHEAGYAGFDDADVVTLSRQLAELAAEAGELELARGALDRLLSLHPQEAEAAQARFALDPDRRRAVTALAEVAGRIRSEATRAHLLALAADAALVELGDRRLGERLYREARAEGARVPGLAVALAARRARATRAADLGPEALLGALRDAADAAQQAGQPAAARALLEEAVAEERARGMKAAAARDLGQLEALHAAEGDLSAAAARALEAGVLHAEAGDLEAAAAALGRAADGDPGDDRALRQLATVSATRGADGAADLVRALAALAARASPGASRAEALVRLAAAEATALGEDRRAEATLRDALAEAPGDAAAEAALLALLARSGRDGERARLLLDRARRQPDAAVRAGYRREAARLLAASPEAADRALVPDTLVAVTLDAPADLEAARAAAAALLAAGRRDEAIPHLAALVRADPDDEASAGELAVAYADRHRERAELFLARAARAQGQARAARLREAARALTAAEDPARAREALAQAFDAWPADDAAFSAALGLAGDDVDRLDAVLRARAEALPDEAHGCHRARADALFAAGRLDQAIAAYETGLALVADDPAALASLGACLAALGGEAAARGADRRLCDLATARPGVVPGSLEAEARYRLGLTADPEGPAVDVRADLERALWLAPEDRRADAAFAALGEAQLRLGDVPAALAVARARAERAAASGDAQAERRALQAGVALLDRVGEPGPDGAALLDGLLAQRAAAGEPLEDLVPLAVRAATAWRALGVESRAREALDRAGITPPPPRPLLTPLPTPPPESLEAVVVEAAEAQPPAEETVAIEPVEAQPPAEETVAIEPVEEQPPAEETVAIEPVEAQPPAEETVAIEPVEAQPPAEETVAIEPVEEQPPAEETVAIEPVEAQPPAEETVAIEPVEAQPPAEETAEAPGDTSADPRADAEALAASAQALADPAERAEAWIASAEALVRAGAGADEVRTALELACDADPDQPGPWRALAAHEAATGASLAAARAALAVSIRTEGEEAALAALTAARFFEEGGRHQEAARAFRAANVARPRAVPPALILAEDALAHGDLAAAAENLGLVEPQALPEAALAAFERARRRVAGPSEGEAIAPAAAEAAPMEPLPLEVAAEVSSEVSAEVTAGVPAEAAALPSDERPSAPAAGPLALADPVAAILREQADLADGPDRAALLERLAGHHERSGQPGLAADALLEALAADGTRTATWERLEGLVHDDEARSARATALRSALLGPAVAEPEASADLPGSTDPWLPAAVAGEEAASPLGVALPPDAAAPPPGPAAPRSTSTDPWLSAAEPRPEPAAPLPGSTDPWLTAAALPDEPSLETWATPGDDAAAAGAEPAPEPEPEAAPEDPGPAIPVRTSTAPWMPAAELPSDAPSGFTTEATSDAALEPATAPEGEPVPGAEPEPGLAAEPVPESVPGFSIGAELEAEPRGEPEPEAEPPPVPVPGEALASEPPSLEPTAPAAEAEPFTAEPEPTAPAAEAEPFTAEPEPEPEPAPPPFALEPEGEAIPPPATAPPRDRAAEVRALVREHAAVNNRRALAALSAEAEAVLGVEALRPYAASLGRAALEAGRAEEAYRWLSLARQEDPGELTVARDLSRAAEKTGRHAEEVELGELCADAIAPHDPLAAAARYRHFARVLSDRVGDAGAAASMLEKALTLVPDDADGRRDLWSLWGRRRETQARALDAWLDAARSDPSDATALSQVAELSERLAAGAPMDVAARHLERARLASSLAAFVAPGRVAPPLRLAAVVPDSARDRIATPGAVGPLGRLLALLAPYLEPLFPADLGRRGATPADRLVAPRAPVVRDALDAAGRILGARPYVPFLVDRPGVELGLENTQPPALVVPAGVEALPAAAVHFLAARAVDLLGRGWTLSGKFAPRDVGILLELACRFAGGEPPGLGLPLQRAGAFLEALSHSVPPSVAARAFPLGPGAAEELHHTDVRALAVALRRTGSRVALLVTGDPGAALAALALLERQRPEPRDPAAALELPDLRDLALLALSDPFLDLRVAVVG